jgi:hypothetical protein
MPDHGWRGGSARDQALRCLCWNITGRERNEFEGDLAQALRRALGPADALTIERLAQLIEEVKLRLFTHHLTPSSSSGAMGSWISTASATGFWTQLLQILLSLLSNDLQILLPKRDSRRSTL